MLVILRLMNPAQDDEPFWACKKRGLGRTFLGSAKFGQVEYLRMSLAAGTMFGPYSVVAPIGAGGMGEVYRARDTRLGRDVALKILPASFASDPERLHRFQQEARAVAALNHPNILAVYDLGAQDGAPYLVAELLEGASLRAMLETGALPQRKAAEFGVQVAHGLAAAHDRGIVHRDLKPENIFCLRDGRIKILDFGLAKLAAPEADANDANQTMAQSHTSAGMVLGTVGYMAPEQVRGEAVDARTDIFAFGAVLYEMLSGTRAFKKDTAVETMTAILREDPQELSGIRTMVSPGMDRIVRRCMEKNPEQRFQSAKDLSFALSSLSGNDASGLGTSSTSRAALAAAPVAARKIHWGLWSGIAAALLAAVALTWFFARQHAPAPQMHFTLAGTEDVSISQMALSADGTMLTFIAPDPVSELPMVWVQRIGSDFATPIAGTQGASYPFWSPDAQSVAYFANGKLWKVPAAGGNAQALAPAVSGRGGSWGSRNIIAFAPAATAGIYRVNADGTGLAPLTNDLLKNSGADNHRWPLFLPDGNHFLYWSGRFNNLKDEPSTGVFLTDLDAREGKMLMRCHSNFSFDEHHLYFADDRQQLVSVAFDPHGGTVLGSATVVAPAVGYQPALYRAALTAGGKGTVVFNTGVGAAMSQLTWVDRSGKVLGTVGQAGMQANPALSPDGSRVALDRSDVKADNVDIWLESTRGPGETRFTFDPSEDVNAVWSRDGSQIGYRSVPDATHLMVKRADGTVATRTVAALPTINAADDILPNDWSPDSAQLLVTYQGVDSMWLRLIAIADGRPTDLVKAKANFTNGQFSADGKWLAYAGDETGAWEIYVTSYPSLAGKWQVSRGGGVEPRWRNDGKEIFYIAPNGVLNAAPISTAQGFEAGVPVPLFQVHGRATVSSTDLFTYDVAKDGQRFLVNRYVKPEHVAPLNVVLNAGNVKSN